MNGSGEPVRGMLFEGPSSIETGRFQETAKAIADWVLDPQRLDRGRWVAGVYGPRGSGKTSLLLTVLAELRERKQKGKGDVCLPNFSKNLDLSLTTPLFAPADTRDHDDLYFLLLDHLKEYYQSEGNEELLQSAKNAFQKAREQEVQRQDFKYVLEYEQEVSASKKRMVENLVRLREETATTTRSLTKAFKSICASYTSCATGKTIDLETSSSAGKRPFLLLVDDLDLKPGRAVEMLELLRLFFEHPGVVVLVAADPDLLSEAVHLFLKKSELNPPGLAHSLIAKLVPYRWHLPLPSENERFERLWNQATIHGSSKIVESELRLWWKEGARETLFKLEENRVFDSQVDALREQDVPDYEMDLENIRKEGRIDAQKKYGTLEQAVKTTMGPFLPSTYRGLVALHNLFYTESSQKENIRFFRENFGLPDELVRPFFCVVAAVDVEFREIGLLDEILTQPREVFDAFYALLPSWGSTADSTMGMGMDDRPISYGVEDTFDLPLLDRLQLPWFSGRRLGRAKRVLRELAEMWDWWKQGAPIVERAKKFIAVSLNTNALIRGKELWAGLFKEEEVLHLDLQKFCLRYPSFPVELRCARERSEDFIKEENIDAIAPTDRIELFSRIQLPLACWLGWRLRKLRIITAYNDFEGTFTPFTGPARPLRHDDRRKYSLLEPDRTVDPRNKHKNAILLVDLQGKSIPDQLNRFYSEETDEEDQNLKAGLQVRMVPKTSGWGLKPEDLQDALQDVFECIYGLRHHNGVRTIHMGLACPDVFAFFLGHELHTMGDIQLYEYYGESESEGYRRVFSLKGEAKCPSPT